jgi:hypothetical protein
MQFLIQYIIQSPKYFLEDDRKCVDLGNDYIRDFIDLAKKHDSDELELWYHLDMREDLMVIFKLFDFKINYSVIETRVDCKVYKDFYGYPVKCHDCIGPRYCSELFLIHDTNINDNLTIENKIDTKVGKIYDLQELIYDNLFDKNITLKYVVEELKSSYPKELNKIILEFIG